MATGAIRRLLYTAKQRPRDDPLYRRLLATPFNAGEIVAETLDEYISSGRKVDGAHLISCARVLRTKPNHALQVSN